MSDTKQAGVDALALVIATAIITFFLAGVFSFFTAWLLMVGLGNVGVNVSYLGTFPLAFLLTWKGFPIINNKK